ncbi:hypothetical protein M3697_14515 [Janibacter melonis]|uniref:hypothetical protein n=1 Tax=Janibacter melonis TaxID=262209 RepID=UPI002043C89E|nr:hypothetical protein [Janibacter melonis]MCM3556304.1 hypothetical protein [Janibacter melonis]
MDILAAGPCPTCGGDAASVVADSRFDASGAHEKLTLTCPDGHSWTVTDHDDPGPVRRVLAHLLP